MTEGLVDTSVLIDWDQPSVVAALLDILAVSASWSSRLGVRIDRA